MGALACKTKIIINGGAVQDLANRLCYRVEDTPEDSLNYDQWIGIIKHLNAAEDSMHKAQRAYLEAVGFQGPWPNSLKS